MKKSIIILLVLLLTAGTARTQVLTLDSCLAAAKRNSYAIRQAKNDVQRAQEVKAQALTKYFPQVSGSASGYYAFKPILEIGIDDISDPRARDVLYYLYETYGKALGLRNPYSIINQRGYTASATAVQPIYMGGKIVAGNKLAKVGVEVAQLQQQVAERECMQGVEEKYWLCVALQEKQQTLSDMQMLLDTLELTVSTAVDAGLALNNDLLRVSLKKDETAAQVLQLTNGIRLAKKALCQAICIPYSDGLVIADSLPAVNEEGMEMLLPMADSSYVRPEVQMLALQVRAEQLRKRMALADALPKVAAAATYGCSNIFFNHLSHSGMVGVTLQVPITGWWETSHKLKEHNCQISNAQLQQSDLTGQMALQEEQALSSVLEAAALITQYQRSRLTAEENYRLALLGYQTGMKPLSELLEAQTLLSLARQNLTDARIRHRLSLRRYQSLTSD